MVGRFFGWRLVTLVSGLIAFAMHANLVSGQELADRDKLRLVADATNIQSRMIAVGIGSLAKLEIETFDIDAVWAGLRDTPLDLIAKDNNRLGLVDISKTNLAELEAVTGLRAVMKLWSIDESQEQIVAGAHPGYLLVAKSSVRPDFVQALLNMIQNDSLVLKAVNVDLGKLDPPISLLDLPLPHHQGVHDYLEASHTELTAVSAPDRDTIDPTVGRSGKAKRIAADQTAISNAVENGKSYTVFFETDNADLDPNDIKSVAEACRYAATLPRARFIISGHTDTVGSAFYNNKLAKVRAESVANAIRNDPRFREALSVMEYGETNLAVATDDEVPEARNRRVKLTIVEDQ
ncbi:MAG: OmpA family protein [Geminicoccaceae bacterium]